MTLYKKSRLYRGALSIGRKVLPNSAIHAIKKVYSFPTVDMGESMMGEGRMAKMLELLEKSHTLEGDVIECGVYRGGGTIAMAKKLQELGVKKVVYGLDTFEGFPFAHEEDKTNGKQLAYKGHLGDTSLDGVQKAVDKAGVSDEVILMKGLFTESFPDLEDKKFCFAYVDADLYLSIKQSVEFLKPRMVEGGVIMFDDYNSNVWGGASRAVHETLGEENIVKLPRKGAYWVKK